MTRTKELIELEAAGQFTKSLLPSSTYDAPADCYAEFRRQAEHVRDLVFASMREEIRDTLRVICDRDWTYGNQDELSAIVHGRAILAKIDALEGNK